MERKAYSRYKERAVRLRKCGKTYAEICEMLNVKIPKGTLSTWCGALPMSDEYRAKVKIANTLNLKNGRKISRAMKILRHRNLLADLRVNNQYLKRSVIDPGVLKIILSILYLGEGAKWRSHRGLMLGNSDLGIVQLYIALLSLCYGIKPEIMKCRICYRADQNIHTLQEYWSQSTNIPLGNFYKTKPDARTIGIPTRRKDYMGVCVIMCAGTRIQLELDVIAKMIVEWVAKGPIAQW